MEACTLVGAVTFGLADVAPETGFEVLTLTVVGAETCGGAGGGLVLTGATCAAAGLAASDDKRASPATIEIRSERCMQHLFMVMAALGGAGHTPPPVTAL